MVEARVSALEEARRLALSRRYDAALRVVEKLLLIDRDDPDALQLKGNILDLEASDEQLGLDANLRSLKLKRSRECYHRILELDPRNIAALKDLGDSWLSENAETALDYYEQVLSRPEAERAKLPAGELEDMLERRLEALEKLGRPAGKVP
jgi:tetratricopeptide (TPR) repeat protein